MAFLLAGLSALLHASWNLAGKRYAKLPGFYLMANAWSLFLLAPLLFFYSELFLVLLSTHPVLLLLSIAAQLIYMGLLPVAYRHGDLSLVYPIARTAPVLMIFIYECLFKPFLVHHWIYTLGMGALCIGVLVTSRPGKSVSPWRGVTLAFIMALAISTYSILDHRILNLVRSKVNVSELVLCLGYMVILQIGIVLGLMIPFVLKKTYRRKVYGTVKEAGLGSFKMGAGIFGSYVAALMAMTHTQKLSLVVSVRQLSIPLGFLFGIYLLREKSSPLKWLGLTMICVGLFMVGMF